MTNWVGVTQHCSLRLSQRKVSSEVLRLVLEAGCPIGSKEERILLTPRMVTQLRREGIYTSDLLDRVEKCAPIVVVLSRGMVITVFRPTRRIHSRRGGLCRN